MSLIKKKIFYLSIFIYSIFFLGFIFNENSIGSGGYNGDLLWMWKNFSIFKNNSLINSINSYDFTGNRTPLLYIINILFNPFINQIEQYRMSIFVFSFLGPITLYLFLKNKFLNVNKETILLISSFLVLSPFYRSSAIWGLEINYGIISSILSIYFLNILKEEKKFSSLFLTILFSSLCVYFDQKLIIIPIYCMVNIYKTCVKRDIYYALLIYLLFSLPFIYLIKIWGGIVPKQTQTFNPEALNSILNLKFHYYNIGYGSTLIACYLLPLIALFKKISISNFTEFLENNIKIIVIPCGLYIAVFLYFDGYEMAQTVLPTNVLTNTTYGLGFINKFSHILFESINHQKIFLSLSFIFSWVVLLYSISEKIFSWYLGFYFFVISLALTPLMQEYFDPYVFLFGLLFIGKNIKIVPMGPLYAFFILFFYLSFAVFFYNT
jgi:hypothetical protein